MTPSHETGSEMTASDLENDDCDDFVTMVVDGQWLGIPALSVQDVLGPQKITRVPLAPREVAGALNLRGRIVTAIDLRVRIGLPPRPDEMKPMSSTFEEGSDLYSLLVDDVGEVLSLKATSFDPNPVALDSVLREVSNGIYPLEDKLLVVLDPSRLLSFGTA